MTVDGASMGVGTLNAEACLSTLASGDGWVARVESAQRWHAWELSEGTLSLDMDAHSARAERTSDAQ